MSGKYLRRILLFATNTIRAVIGFAMALFIILFISNLLNLNDRVRSSLIGISFCLSFYAAFKKDDYKKTASGAQTETPQTHRPAPAPNKAHFVLANADLFRYCMWASPFFIVCVYAIVIRGLHSPVIFAILTSVAIYYAIYPLERERTHLLTTSFYYPDRSDVPRISLIIIGVEALFVIFSALTFSCDGMTSDISEFWLRSLILTYLSFGLLWVQTNGFSDYQHGLRRYYFKMSLIVGIFYSAVMTILSYNAFSSVKGALLEIYSNSDLTKIQNRDICATFQLSGDISNTVASFFPPPLNIAVMAFANLDILVGFVISAHILAVIYFCRRKIAIHVENNPCSDQ